MLDALQADVAEVIQIRVIMVHIRNSREVQARYMILYDSEICEHRHEAINYSRKGICIRIPGRRSIEVCNF